MEPLVDDIGSFPLPSNVNGETFNRAYRFARDTLHEDKDEKLSEFLQENFVDVVLGSFRAKLHTGLDVVNYPQQYSGIDQVGDVIHKAMAKGVFVVDEKDAFLPEVQVIAAHGKELSEEFDGKQIQLRVSLFGPMEQYLKEIGTTAYPDVLEGFAETIRRFAKNSLLNTKYIRTSVVSIDEPSFGFLNINAESELLRGILEKAYDFSGAKRQIHLHSSARLFDLLGTKNIDVLSFEYAASPKNIESVTKRMLDEADKQIRVGVSRTDIDGIIAELYEQGNTNPTPEQIVESEAVIAKRYALVKERFGNRLAFTGPDCGFSGWTDQKAAALLLERTVRAVKAMQAQI
jgi:5-methyltetrahydropteroyltriglutamate--homocysteine methyltransferase